MEKSKWIILLPFLFCLSPIFAAECGDADSNGVVNIVDALIIAQVYVGLNPPPNYNSSAADINADGSVNILDALQIAQFYVGLIDSLPGCSQPTSTATPTPQVPTPDPNWRGCSGYATRFWDCCKPHCGWSENVPSGMSTLQTCAQDGITENSNPSVRSSCDGGSGFMCYKLTPWAVNDSLSYGYAATSSGDVCGKCYEIKFTGEGQYGPNPGSRALTGKRMIIQAINIGHDVGGGQFDIAIPGGGVGAFNGCSTQWGIPNSQLGAQYGGLLTQCQQQVGYDDHAALKSCMKSKVNELFRSKGLTEMADGIDWFVDWFEVADNPKLLYREIPCPQALIDKSGMDRRPLGDVDTSCY